MNKFTVIRHLFRIFFYFFVLGQVFAVSAQGLEIIKLRHRTAEQLIPLLNPLVSERGALSGQGFALIVRGDAGVQRQIRQVLEALDTPMRRLMISVRQVEDIQRSKVEISGGAVLKPGNSVITGTAQARDLAGQDQIEQRIQGLEGVPAYIAVGEQRLIPGAVVSVTPGGGTVVNPVVQPVEAITGFYVLPRLSGHEVQLEISPQKQAFDANGQIRRSAMVTLVQGRLGEWIDLGGTEAGSQSSGTSWIGMSRNAQGQRLRLQVRVEEIK